MPKHTFYNLDEEKKEKIFGAAVKEFSARRFSEASINQIVKTAGIPRGSFYQYFSGKEDVYAYIAGEIAKEQSVVAGFIEPPGADAGVFDEIIYKARAAIELYRVRPRYRQIAQLMEQDDSEFIKRLRSVSEKDESRLKELIERDKQRGLIKPNADAGVIAKMANSLTTREYLSEGYDSSVIMERINQILKVISEGIAAEGS